MVPVNETTNRELLIGFSIASVLLFGFIAWRPQVWVSLTPIKPCSVERLATIYRWIAIITLAGVLVNLSVAKK
jgi:hypothetical protein